MGADITDNPAARTIVIRGVRTLGGATIGVMPDRNEVVSFASAALATGGEVLIPEVSGEHLGAFLSKVVEIGARYELLPSGLRFIGTRPYRRVGIETAPHPGFMTDWQQPFCVVLTGAEGESIIHETVYEDRFGYTKDLVRMGAAISISDACPDTTPCRFWGKGFMHSARVSGPAILQGREIVIGDIRAGMAHIIAALAAQGESVISGIEHVDRGYERIEERLQELGAEIQRVSG
jgi:UDP-N-acetylglucosamine 1-carboxyvinyltransferase